MAEMVNDGGCYCGAVRYRIEGAPLASGYCHCRMCQRVVGAPVVAWGIWTSDRLSWLRGKPATFRSSAHAERMFCPTCGTSLAARSFGQPPIVDVSLATLDDPAAIPPQEHVWTSSRVPWLEIADDLPRHSGGKTA